MPVTFPARASGGHRPAVSGRWREVPAPALAHVQRQGDAAAGSSQQGDAGDGLRIGAHGGAYRAIVGHLGDLHFAQWSVELLLQHRGMGRREGGGV